MVSGLIYRIKGSYSMRQLGDLYAKYPLLSLLMAIPLFSVAGIPPLSGFWPKLSLISESFAIDNYWLVAAIMFATFITIFVIAKLWAEVFWKKGDAIPKILNFKYFDSMRIEKKIEVVAPIVFLAAISLYIGFGAEHIQQLSLRISDELIDPQVYIQAVLGK